MAEDDFHEFKKELVEFFTLFLKSADYPKKGNGTVCSQRWFGDIVFKY